MHDELGDLAVDLAMEILLERLGWGVVVSLHGQMVGVFLLHQLKEMLLDVGDHCRLLLHRAVLYHGLKDSAAIVLEDQLLVLILCLTLFRCCDEVHALLNQLLLVLLELLLFHQKLIVVQSQCLDQI